jgi:hypothetical protein
MCPTLAFVNQCLLSHLMTHITHNTALQRRHATCWWVTHVTSWTIHTATHGLTWTRRVTLRVRHLGICGFFTFIPFALNFNVPLSFDGRHPCTGHYHEMNLEDAENIMHHSALHTSQNIDIAIDVIKSYAMQDQWRYIAQDSAFLLGARIASPLDTATSVPKDTHIRTDYNVPAEDIIHTKLAIFYPYQAPDGNTVIMLSVRRPLQQHDDANLSGYVCLLLESGHYRTLLFPPNTHFHLTFIDNALSCDYRLVLHGARALS